MPETSCMKRTSVHIKNMRIKQLRNRNVRDFTMAFWPEKFLGLSRNGLLGFFSRSQFCQKLDIFNSS